MPNKLSTEVKSLIPIGKEILIAYLTYQTLGGLELIASNFSIPHIFWVVVASTAIIAGRLKDHYSTIETVKTLNQADSVGVDHSFNEASILLPQRPTERDVLSKKMLIVDSTLLIMAAINPPLGTAVGLLAARAAHSNEKTNAELKLRIEKVSLKEI